MMKHLIQHAMSKYFQEATVAQCQRAGLLASRSNDRSCSRGKIFNKLHLRHLAEVFVNLAEFTIIEAVFTFCIHCQYSGIYSYQNSICSQCSTIYYLYSSIYNQYTCIYCHCSIIIHQSPRVLQVHPRASCPRRGDYSLWNN